MTAHESDEAPEPGRSGASPSVEPSSVEATTFDFRFTLAYRLASLPFGIRPGTAWARVTDTELRVRFGPWRFGTALTNIVELSLTGPYRWPLTAGPARLSVTDRGLTFATNPDAGLCLRLGRPLPGIEPFGVLRHPGLTLTVREPRRLADLLASHVPALELPA